MEPSVTSVERFSFFADSLSEPFSNHWAVDVVVIDPTLIAGVVRRIDVDALDLPRVVGKERFERDEVISLHDEIPVARLAAGEIWHVFEQVKRHLVVMIHHCLFPNPIQCWHINEEVQFAAEEYPFPCEKAPGLSCLNRCS